MKVALYGYGNLGRGVEYAVSRQEDMELVGIFTRRDPAAIHPVSGVPVYAADRLDDFTEAVDVLILCGGSATDLPHMTPALAGKFHVVDSFDTHADIPAHFAAVDKAAAESGHVALISCGWDPGLFSLIRVLGSAVLPDGADYTFGGRGVSQGHSDAIRRIPGVVDARQYTVPVPSALEAVRRGEAPDLTVGQKHTRECYVVAAEGADKARIERDIKTMPNYFADYETTVHFISEEELQRNHAGIPHGGCVIRTGKTGWQGENKHRLEFDLTLDSNPEFTAGVLVAYARAVGRMSRRGVTGCKTVLDVTPADLSPLSPEELRAHML